MKTQAKELYEQQMRSIRAAGGEFEPRTTTPAAVIFNYRTRLHDELSDNCAQPTDPLWILKELSRQRRAAIARYRTNLPYDKAIYFRQHSGLPIYVCRTSNGFMIAAFSPRVAEQARDDYDAMLSSCAKMNKDKR